MSTSRRKFTDEFKVGDKVGIIRHKHGWHDGDLEGVVISLSESQCIVKDENGYALEIRHCRDIRKLTR